MGTESNGTTGSESALRRTREPTPENKDRSRWALATKLPSSRWFRPAVLGVCAGVAGVLLAPELATRSYPIDEALINTPVTENIKAPYDIDVTDELTTARLREEAVAQARRVFDFDALLGVKTGERIGGAFSTMLARVDEILAAEQIDRVEGLPRAVRERLAEQVRSMAQSARADFEKDLGITVTAEQLRTLGTAFFAPSLSAALQRAVVDAQARPIVPSQSALETDRGKGITVQRVPRADSQDQLVDDVNSIPTLAAVRDGLPAIVGELLAEATPAERGVVAALAQDLVAPSLTLNRNETELAREIAAVSVTPAIIAVKKGEMIIRDGERLKPRQLAILQALAQSRSRAPIVLVALGAGIIVLVLVVTGFRFAEGRGRGLDLRPRDVLFLAVLFMLAVGGARLWLLIAHGLHERFPGVPLEAFLFALPVAAGSMVARLVVRTEAALLFALTASLVMGLLADGGRAFPLFVLVGCVLGCTTISTISARSDLVRAAVWIGLGQMATAFGIQLFGAGTQLSAYLITLPVAFAGGMLSGFVALGLTPAVEATFGYTTDLKLLELGNLNHPALKELIVAAPGSYHHSVIVGSLVEAAAEAIDANPLLARVMAYYHDLGKGQNSTYFIENQRSGQNPHDKLKPSMSVMIIRRHVTDGLQLAKRYGLGETIMAGIAEHHGTTLIHFFYRKAKEQEEAKNPVSESDYRYPGRKPQSREAALVMLADSVEAASRTLADPTPARLQGLISRVVNLKFTDGQLDDCDLTLRDLHTIAKSFSRVLNSIYHQRLEYPELLKDIAGPGKKQNGDLDSKPAKKAEGADASAEDDRPDNLRRLGLS